MDNQQHLLHCAMKLFSQRGYDAVGVQEIVDLAGVTKPTLYHYFDSKHGLLEALLQVESTVLLTAISKAAIYHGDLVQTLENITRAYFSFAQQFPEFYRMQISMYFAPPESESHQAIRPYYQAQLDLLSDVFIQAAANHGNLQGRHQRYAIGLLGTINAMIGLFYSGQIELNDQIVYQTIHQFMYGIFS
jgi:TetR/AcrR family transcriptional regulator